MPENDSNNKIGKRLWQLIRSAFKRGNSAKTEDAIVHDLLKHFAAHKIHAIAENHRPFAYTVRSAEFVHRGTLSATSIPEAEAMLKDMYECGLPLLIEVTHLVP